MKSLISALLMLLAISAKAATMQEISARDGFQLYNQFACISSDKTDALGVEFPDYPMFCVNFTIEGKRYQAILDPNDSSYRVKYLLTEDSSNELMRVDPNSLIPSI